MEKYDVIIVGGGIAGSSLAYNLKNRGFKGSVLLIEKNNRMPGKGYNTRVCFREVVDEYDLPVKLIFRGMKLGSAEKIVSSIDHQLYSIDYRKTCSYLQSRSGYNIRQERAVDVIKNKLRTNKSVYRFRYLVDCSGISYFLRKKFNLSTPYAYWLGWTKEIRTGHDLKKEYIYNLWNDEGDFEEIYVEEDRLVHGNWTFSRNIDFSGLRNIKNTYLEKLDSGIINSQFRAFPVSISLPLTFRNYAFLGDSFGNAPAGSGFGCEAAIRASEVLSGALIRNDLDYYEDRWLSLNRSYDTKFLVSRLDRYEKNYFLKKIKNYPGMMKIVNYMKDDHEAWISLLKNDRSLKLDKEFVNLFPRRRYLFLLLHLAEVKLREGVMRSRMLLNC